MFGELPFYLKNEHPLKPHCKFCDDLLMVESIDTDKGEALLRCYCPHFLSRSKSFWYKWDPDEVPEDDA